MSDAKQTNWLPWVIVAGLAYFAFVRQPQVGPIDPPQPPRQTITRILDAAYTQDRSDKLAILKEFADRQFANDQEALKWFNDQSNARRIETFTPFTDRVGQAIFDGKVKELAAEMEAGR